MTTTLHSPPVASLLTQLFADARKTDATVLAPFSALPAEERRARLDRDPRAFYASVAQAYLPVSEELGRLLYALARARRARTVVEFGTSFGISTVHLAAALRDNGGGKLITTEYEASKVHRAKEHLAKAGLVDLVEFRVGDALETLRADVPDGIDLVLLDGAKPLYLPLLRMLEPKLGPGAILVADNVKMSPEFAAHLSRPEHGYVTIPLPWEDDDCLFAVRAA
ncbi:O-methyltransferase family protein [Corallococcus coralloides DSM 2259]|uniref:O-methyltransferase family protein n=1 Tax=Corallococcus coralloides (strain ATCC 25202 / DSM 2259 / NBRC 100086 / M2) TaxID=1144275 RepID=H8MI87_CORCM|nr:class I SAM-dependent methyltransferase [Corallococcus coralloides]AFE06630.1 O-methyltransferase family protein [Corallococcus coralloides DSM 2259]